MKPLVSILIPAYNAEEWISDTLRSAIAQTWERKEILVVDDGSKDRTLAIARKFESEGVRVITQPNQGAAAARNKALSSCRGDYIQYLDADDLLAPAKIALQMEALESLADRRMLVSGPWGEFMYRHDRAKFAPSALWCDLSPIEWLLRKMQFNTYMQTASWIVSRELAEEAGPWDPALLVDDDGEYFCRVILASHGVKFVPEAKVYYRNSGAGSLSYIGLSSPKMAAQWRSMKLHVGYIRSLEESQRVREGCLTYLQCWIGSFYSSRPDLVKQAEELAASLGGALYPPALSWKYSWMVPLCGREQARRAKVLLPRIKWELIRRVEKTLYRLEGKNLQGGLNRT